MATIRVAIRPIRRMLRCARTLNSHPDWPSYAVSILPLKPASHDLASRTIIRSCTPLFVFSRLFSLCRALLGASLSSPTTSARQVPSIPASSKRTSPIPSACPAIPRQCAHHRATPLSLSANRCAGYGYRAQLRITTKTISFRCVSVDIPSDPRNLWPEPVAGQWSASVKDQLESSVCRAVCKGAMTLREGQEIFMDEPDRTKAYEKFFGLK